jgi:hypothetical protein
MSAGAVRAGGVFVEIGADPTKFFGALKGMNKSIGSIGRAMTSAGTKMAAIGAGVVGPIFASAAAFASVGSALYDMSKRTGVATESLSVLQFAAEQTGTDMSGVETAVKKMQKAIFAAGNGSKEAAAALAMVGLSANDLAGLSADEQMGKIADGLMSIQDPGARAAVAMQIFGKSGTSILPMLEGGSAGMAAFAAEAKKLGLIMDSETAAKADALGDAIDALNSSMKMAFIQVGSAVAPILTQLAQGLAIVAANVGRFISENQSLVVSVLKGGAALVAVGSGLSVLGRAITLASTSFGVLGTAASLALSPLTMLIVGASGIAKSFTMAMPATLALANSIGSSMLGASASVLSFAATSTSALAVFATSSATALAGFAASSAAGFVRMSGAASAAAQAMFPVFFTGFNRGIAAGAGFFSATLRGLNGVVMASSALRGALFAVSGSGMARFVGDIVGGLTLTYKSFVWWATGASARLAQYAVNVYMAAAATVANAARMGASWVASALPGLAAFATAAAGLLTKYVGSTVMAAVASVTNAVRSGAAWVASALPGVLAFVGGAVAGIASYLGAAAMAVAGSVASAAAVAAAWLAPLAPFALLAAAAVGVGAAIKQLAPQISGAFSSVSGYVSEAGGAISGGFSTAVSDGIVVLGDLAKTATTTFNGVYEAVAAGDLSGAMDVLWAGLVAGWLRGTEALMSYVDPWVAAFQDVFTDIGSGIYIAWDKIYTDSAALLNTMGAFIMGFFDNIANGVMATFDNLVAAIQIAWTRVQGFITGAKDTEERVQAIKDENAARAEQRMQERPGVNARADKAAAENAKAEAARMDRKQAALDDAQATKEGRQATNNQRAADRRAATAAAEGNLASVTTGASEGRKDAAIAAELLKSLETASSLDDITNIGVSIDALIQRGNVSGEMESKLLDAYYAAFSRVNIDSASASSEKAAKGGASSAGDSKAEVAGTFSANVNGMGFGSSLAERQLKTLESIEKNTRGSGEEGKVAA